jgi:hypothetical protein
MVREELFKPVLCPICMNPSFEYVSHNKQQYLICEICDKEIPFYHSSCPRCKELCISYNKPEVNTLIQCQNCMTFIHFSEVIDTVEGFNIKFKCYSGKHEQYFKALLKRSQVPKYRLLLVQ